MQLRNILVFRENSMTVPLIYLVWSATKGELKSIHIFIYTVIRKSQSVRKLMSCFIARIDVKIDCNHVMPRAIFSSFSQPGSEVALQGVENTDRNIKVTLMNKIRWAYLKSQGKVCKGANNLHQSAISLKPATSEAYNVDYLVTVAHVKGRDIKDRQHVNSQSVKLTCSKKENKAKIWANFSRYNLWWLDHMEHLQNSSYPTEPTEELL